MAYAALTSFNAGELSPRMIGRTDVSQYFKGCRTLNNFLVTPYGAVERRPGTMFLGRAKSDKVRLVPFVFSSEVSFILEFGHNCCRFFTGRHQVTADGVPLEITTPYSAEDLPRMKFIQSADVMTIVHPDHPVRELKRTAELVFELTEKEFQYPPVLEPNIDDDFTFTPSAREGEITLSTSKDFFEVGNVGGFVQLIHTRKESSIEKDFKSDTTSETLEVFGFWTFTTHGTWTGEIHIERSFDNGNTWYTYRSYSSSKDSNVNTSGTEELENVLYRMRMSDYEQSSSGTLKMCRAVLTNPDFVTTGVVKITSVTDARSAAGTVIKKLGSIESTAEWNEGAWSNRRGFPGSVAYYEERMIFGGTYHSPQTVWGSKTGDWDNFLLSDKDDAGLEFTLSSDTVNTITWLCGHKDALIIGTMDSEWTLSASSKEEALTPSNFRVKRHSVYGSGNISALLVGDTLLFIQRGERKVREFAYSYEKDGFVAPDMTILADHITHSRITEVALQQQPDTILWCVLGNGTLAALTYERDQEVIGWHRHDTPGKILSAAVIPNEISKDLYLAVERENGTFIEMMAPREFEGIENACFLDSAVTVRGEGLLEVSGLEHLEGQTVSVLIDGALGIPQTVFEGMITLDRPADTVTVGLPFESHLKTMPIEMDLQNGSSQLRKKSVGELRLRVYDSVGGEVCCGQDRWQIIVSRDVLEDDMDAAVTPKTAPYTFNLLSGYESECSVEVRQRDPLPFNMSSLVVNISVEN